MAEITARQLALAYILTCNNLGVEPEIKKPSTLEFIAKQLSGPLNSSSNTMRASFLAYWVSKHKPFKNLNLATAVVLALAISQKNFEAESIENLKSQLKAGAGIDRLANYL